MSKANLQSLKSKNATQITVLHKQVSNRKKRARALFEAAFAELKEMRKATATIKKLARQQITIKKELKGPAKPARPAKADTRPAPANPKVGGVATAAIYQLPTTAVTGGAVSVATA